MEHSRGSLDLPSRLAWDLLEGAGARAISVAAKEANADDPRTMADLARAAWYLGERRVSDDLIAVALRRGPADDDEVAWIAASLAHPSSRERARLTKNWHLALAAAEGAFSEARYGDARALVWAAIEAFRRALTNKTSSVGNAPAAARFAIRAARGLVALGADETAIEWALVADPGDLPFFVMKPLIAAVVASASPNRGKAAERIVVEYIEQLSTLSAPTSALNACEWVVDVALQLDARSVAQVFAVTADAACAATMDCAGQEVFSAISASRLAQCCYRAGLHRRADELLARVIEVDAHIARTKTKTGESGTAALCLVHTLTTMQRWTEVPAALERLGAAPNELRAAVQGALFDEQGGRLLEWARRNSDSSLEYVAQTIRGAVWPDMRSWACLDSVLVPREQRPPVRVDGPLRIGKFSPTRATQVARPPFRERKAARMEPCDPTIGAVLAADKLTPMPYDELDDALWSAVAMRFGAPEELGGNVELLRYFASRFVQWDVDNGGFSKAACNCLEWFDAAADGYDAIGLPKAAARIREVLPAARVHRALMRREEPPAAAADTPASFDEFENDLDDLGWEADEARIAYVRAHRAAIIRALAQEE